MRGGAGGSTLISNLLGTAAGAVVGSGASRLVLGGLSAAGARAAAGPAIRGRPMASQLSLPLAVGVSAGNGAEQLSLPVAVPHSTSAGV